MSENEKIEDNEKGGAFESAAILELKTDNDGFEVEYSIIPYDETQQGLDFVNQRLNDNYNKISELDAEIDRLTNHADGVDYAVAVTCGIVSGLIDSIFVGEWNFENAKAVSNEEINRKVIEFAKKQGYKGDRLGEAINFLEKKFPLPGDGAWNGEELAKNITAKTHHLDDFCHHPTLIGLICCVIVQFTGTTVYSDKNGTAVELPITVNDYGNFVGKNPVTKMFAGVINWFITVAKTTANRKGHIFSDMAGSKKTAGKGMGLPGSFLSTLKELSSLPVLKDTKFPENLRKAFQNGIGAGKSQIDLGVFNSLFEGASSKFDMRTEMAIKHELKRQALPVIINEVSVRGIYFIRRFADEIKEKKIQSVNELNKIDWKKTLPSKNRTITRMLTISTSTFTAIDLADATIRSAIKSGGVSNPLFAKNFLLRVNFVGAGRCVVAIGTDVYMGVKKNKLQDERVKIMSEQLYFMGAKVSYKRGEMWVEAKNAAEAVEETKEVMKKSVVFFVESVNAIDGDLKSIGANISSAEKNNPGLTEEMQDVLRWG